ncbi:arylsulfatase B-like [Ptychodera flava]|uniref:arylsulfatase B-like n=1 Tax=Ptychodera flava TaxID=63121 RepID=UPI00396A6D53
MIITLALFLFLQTAIVDSRPRRPHIVFILADELGWHDIGYHGGRVQTPVLDRLAMQGIKLENYYVQPMCTPTRSQLMSGRYQIHTGLQHSVIFPDQRLCLPTDEVTVADKLKEAGYSTHMVGKWHLGHYTEACLPTQRGFDSFFGFYNCAVDYYTYDKGKYYVFKNKTRLHMRGKDLWRNDREFEAPKYQGKYQSMVFAEEAQGVLRNHDPDVPLFLYLAFGAVHIPLQVPKKYEDIYRDVKDDSRRILLAMATCMDEAIGNITRTLKDTGIWNNTIFIFSTDNGAATAFGGSSWPLKGGKTSLFEGGIRAVGFINSPLFPSRLWGTVNRQLIHVSDWFPTLVRIAGGQLRGTKPLDGYDQWDTIIQGTPSPRREILINIDPMIPCEGCAQQSPWDHKEFDVRVHAGIIAGDWKLVTGNPNHNYWVAPPETPGLKNIYPHEPGKMLWLYNIASDPNEENDLSEDFPGIVDALLDRLAQYNETAVPVMYPDGDPNADPDRRGGSWGPWV